MVLSSTLYNVPVTVPLNLSIRGDYIACITSITYWYMPNGWRIPTTVLVFPATLKKKHPLSGSPPPEQERFMR